MDKKRTKRKKMNDSGAYHLKELTGPPPEIMAEILSMGKEFNEDIIKKVMKLYIPIHKKVAQSGIKITKDLECGQDDRHRLDVHEPVSRPDNPMPIVVFFHGGGFISGDKNSAGESQPPLGVCAHQYR
jgi:hypothetical protein